MFFSKKRFRLASMIACGILASALFTGCGGGEQGGSSGVNGKKIKIVEADSKSEAAESVNAATKLISDDKVIAIVGPAVTANVIAESQIATDNEVPVIGSAATNPDVTVENGTVKPYIFRACFIDPQQSEVMAQFAAKDLNAKTAVLYLDSSSDYSKSLGKIFKEKFEADDGFNFYLYHHGFNPHGDLQERFAHEARTPR